MRQDGPVTLYIAESIDDPGAWTVEAYDNDGGVEQAVFYGQHAADRAREYAAWKYPAKVKPEWTPAISK